MTPSELLRLYAIVRVFLTYGLDELIPKMRLTLLFAWDAVACSGCVISIRKSLWGNDFA